MDSLIVEWRGSIRMLVQWINTAGLALACAGSGVLTVVGPPSLLRVDKKGHNVVTWTNPPPKGKLDANLRFRWGSEVWFRLGFGALGIGSALQILGIWL